jgi:hypothetical protein
VKMVINQSDDSDLKRSQSRYLSMELPQVNLHQ